MADYDLGTAHGKIVIEYKDKGTSQAGKDLDGLKAKSKQLLAEFQNTAKKYGQSARQMASEGQSLFSRLSAAHRNFSADAQQLTEDITRLSKQFGVFAGGLAIATSVITRTGLATNGIKGGINIFRSLGLAMGAVPKGAEGFPDVVKRIIRVSAAVTLFAGSTKLINSVIGRFRGLGTVGKLVEGFGGAVNKLGTPFHAIAGIAGSVAFQLLQLRFVKQIIKPVLAATGALGALGGTLHVVSGLAVSVKDLAGVLLLAPAAAGAAGLAFATLKIGLSGLGDAFKAFDDANKFNEALKNLAPSAADFAKKVRDIYLTGFKELKLDVQQRLFQNLGGVISDLAQTYLPALQDAMGGVADSVNDSVRYIAEFFTYSDEFGNEVPNDVIEGFGFLRQTVMNLVRAMPALVQAFYFMGRVGAEVLADLTKGAQGAAERFADFIKEARASGDLEKWMRNGIQAFRDFWAIIKNVSLALAGIWKGLGGAEGKSFLGTLAEMTAKFNEFVRSAQGAAILQTLGAMFQHAYESAQKLADAFVKYVLPAIQAFLPAGQALSDGVIDGIIEGLRILSPLFIALGAVMSHISPLTAIIVKGMVAFAVVLAGAGLAMKLIGAQILILKSGMSTVKSVMAIGGFATRLFTGNLRAAELQALRLAGALSKQLVKALFSARTAMLLLKWGAIAVAIDAAIGAIKGYSDAQNEAFAKGDFADDVKTFWDDFKQEPFQAVGKEFRASLTPPPSAASDFKAIGDSFMNDLVKPMQNFGQFVNDSITQTFTSIPGLISSALSGLGSLWTTYISTPVGTAIDSIGGFFTGLPGKIMGWLSGLGDSFMTALGQPILDAVGRIKDSFLTDFVGFFTGLPARIGGLLSGLGSAADTGFQGMLDAVAALPGRIGGYLAGLGTQLATDASNAWNSFKTATLSKFDELAGTTGSLPFRLGKALGSLIGMALKWGQDTWNAFYTATATGIDNAVTYVAALPGRIGAFFTTLGQTILTNATTAWNNFYTAAALWIDNAVNYVAALPGRILAYLVTLGVSILTASTTAWNSFYTTAATAVDNAITYLAGLPGRAVAALASFAATLTIWAVNAWNEFNSTSNTYIEQFLAYVAAIPGRVGSAIAGFVTTLVSAAQNAWNQFYARAVALGAQVVAYAAGLPGRIGAAIASLVGLLQQRATAAWNAFRTATIAGANAVFAFVQSIPGRIASFFGNMGNLLVNAGRAIINGLLAGIRAGVQAMYDFVSGIAAGIAARKGPISYDKKLLIPAGNAIIQGLRQGLAQELPALYRMVGGIGDQMSGALAVSSGVNLNGTATVATSTSALNGAPTWNGPTPSGGDGATQNTNTFNVTIPAKDLEEMKSVTDFFDKVTQKARAGKATT